VRTRSEKVGPRGVRLKDVLARGEDVKHERKRIAKVILVGSLEGET